MLGACECHDSSGKCIMAGLALSIPAITWSNCSEHDMLESFKNNKITEQCLYNVPVMINASDIPVITQGK